MSFEISSDTIKELIKIYAPDASQRRKKVLAQRACNTYSYQKC